MATVTRENLGTLHDKITIKLVKEDYLPAFEKNLKQYAKTANIPGFRKGMVPAGLVKKMAGQSIFNEEVMRSAGRELENYLKQQRLIIFGQPMVMPDNDMAPLDMNNPRDLDMSFEIGIKPEFEIPAIKNPARLTAYKIIVTEKMMDDEVERIRRRFGTVESVDEVTVADNVIYCNIQPCDADGNVTGGQKIEEAALVDKFPVKLREQLMGKIAGSVLVFQPNEVCTEQELPGFLKDPLKTTEENAASYYLLTITKIGLLVPMEVGMELYEKVFPNSFVTGETDFREKVKTEIQREFDRMGRERFHNEIFELLVHSTPMPIPVTFLKRWMKEGGEHPKTELEVDQEFGRFEHQLRWQLISEKIMNEAGIDVTNDEVIGDVKKRVLAYYGMDEDEDAPWLAPYMDKVMNDEKMLNETYQRLLTDKLFLVLENQFNTEMKEVDEETFFTLPDAHAMHHHHH